MKKLFVAVLLSVIVSLMSLPAFAASSGSSCYAFTACPYGGAISCQVYGSTYVYGPGAAFQACSWVVIPGVAVQCSGYQQVATPYGGIVWAWENFYFRCPGI